MPLGTITSHTYADVPVSGIFERIYYQHNFDSSSFNNGENLIAVEVHQANPNSSDLGFDFELIGN